jgi:4-hydroxyphenylpyruvate dioxygenase-like putative hemolysin
MHNDVSYENPLKTNGFAFIEFAAKTKANFDNHFTKLGFSQMASNGKYI